MGNPRVIDLVHYEDMSVFSKVYTYVIRSTPPYLEGTNRRRLIFDNPHNHVFMFVHIERDDEQAVSFLPSPTSEIFVYHTLSIIPRKSTLFIDAYLEKGLKVPATSPDPSAVLQQIEHGTFPDVQKVIINPTYEYLDSAGFFDIMVGATITRAA